MKRQLFTGAEIADFLENLQAKRECTEVKLLHAGYARSSEIVMPVASKGNSPVAFEVTAKLQDQVR